MLEARAHARATSRDVESSRDLIEALGALRPEHAAAFRLTQLNDQEIESAAGLLGVQPGTLRVWVHRARRQLTDEWQASRDGGSRRKW